MASRWNGLVTALIVLSAVFVFLKNAWVAEDAYIIFRSVDQLYAGHGPNWNSHERVQAFTSPLWYWVLAGVRFFTTDLYLGSIILSLLLLMGMLCLLSRIAGSTINFAIAVGLLVCANGFFDYTSSGLENILAYLLLTIYMGHYLEFSRVGITKTGIVGLLVTAGLIICVRHDIELLIAPMTIYIIKRNAPHVTRRDWVKLLVMALTPFVLWSLFSLIYYGFPFPNTAYAKMSTGIPRSVLIIQGVNCIVSSLTYDFMTLLVVLGVAFLVFSKTTKMEFRVVGYGIFATLLYFVWVGGDFMQGRFFSYAYLVSVIILLQIMERPDWKINKNMILGLIALFALFYPHTPLNSPFQHKDQTIFQGVANERGFYSELSLSQYIRHRMAGSDAFPVNEWAQEGKAMKNRLDMISIRGNVGLFGYYAGLDHTIVDPLALSDPLLARLPVGDKYRVGHYLRSLPDGYLPSIDTGTPQLKDPRLNEFYTHLKLVTESHDLLAPERLKTIVLFNIGAYNHLLPRRESRAEN